MREKWVKIPGFEVYEISNLGNLRRLTKHRGIRCLTPEVTRLGYIRVRLCVGEKQRRVLIHRLVAESFLDKPSWATEVNHIDGDKSNNNVENLEWSTRRKNIRHAFNSGLMKGLRGEGNSSSKLSLKQVKEIKELLKKPYLGINIDLGKKYGVVPEAISAIRHGKNWGHIK